VDETEIRGAELEGDAGESLGLAIELQLGVMPQVADRGDDLIQYRSSFDWQSSFDEGGVWRLRVERESSFDWQSSFDEGGVWRLRVERESSFDWQSSLDLRLEVELRRSLRGSVFGGRSSPAGGSLLAG